VLTGISAITLATHDMARAVAFYETLGFVLKFGGPAARFTSFRVGSGYLNLMSIPDEHEWGQWCNLPGSVWMQEPPMSWCEQEHGDPLAALELAPLAAAV